MPTPGTVTLAEVRLAAQQRADMENSTFVSTSEWNSMINKSYKKLYDLLVEAYDDDYEGADPVTFQTVANQQFYDLPDGTNFSSAPAFYKLQGVDLSVQGANQQWITLTPFNMAERNRYSPYGVQSTYANSNLKYRLRKNRLWLTPTPQGGQTIQVWYIPQPSNLTQDSDTFDGISGWEEFVILDAAIKGATKEESDTSSLMTQLQAIENRIAAMSENRDAGMPATVTDTQSLAYDPYGDPFGGL